MLLPLLFPNLHLGNTMRTQLILSKVESIMNNPINTIQPIVLRGLALFVFTASLTACENPAEENADDISAPRSVLVEQAETLELLAGIMIGSPKKHA